MKKILNQDKNLLTCTHIHMHLFYLYLSRWTILKIACICMNSFRIVWHKTPSLESKNREISLPEAKSSVHEQLQLLRALAGTESSISRQNPNPCPSSFNTSSFARDSRIGLCLMIIWGLTKKIQPKKPQNKAEQYSEGLFGTLIP